MQKNSLDNIQFFLFSLVVLTLPLPMLINNIAIILFVVISLFKIKEIKIAKPSEKWFFPIIFVLGLVSLSYSCGADNSWKYLERILSFPLFFIFTPTLNVDKDRIIKLLYNFANLCLLLLIYCFLVAAYNIYSTKSLYIFNPENLVNEYFFTYHRFVAPIKFHAVYFSLFLSLSLFIFFHKLYKTRKNKIYTLIKIAIIILGIFLLRSFAVISATFLLALILFFFVKLSLPKLVKWAVAFSLLLSLGYVFYEKAGNFSAEFLEYNIADDIHSKQWNSLNIRLAKWESAIAASEDSNFVGTGVGCSQQLLDKVYKEKGFQIGLDKHFSTHNQYLDYLVELGILGMFLFISFLIWSVIVVYKQKNYFLLIIIILLGLTSFTENVLTLNKGIVFFTTFYYLFRR